MCLTESKSACYWKKKIVAQNSGPICSHLEWMKRLPPLS